MLDSPAQVREMEKLLEQLQFALSIKDRVFAECVRMQIMIYIESHPEGWFRYELLDN